MDDIVYHSLSRPKDQEKCSCNRIPRTRGWTLGDVYRLVDHWLCRPTEDETEGEMDSTRAPVKIPARIRKHLPTFRDLFSKRHLVLLHVIVYM